MCLCMYMYIILIFIYCHLKFIGTELGMQRSLDDILYITEVAVSPKTRRSGTGKLLLQVCTNYDNYNVCMQIFLFQHNNK